MKKILLVIMTLFMTSVIAGCGVFGDDTPKFEGMYKYKYYSIPFVMKIENDNSTYTYFRYERQNGTKLDKTGWIVTDPNKYIYKGKDSGRLVFDQENLVLHVSGNQNYIFYDKKDKKIYYKHGDVKCELIPFTKEDMERFNKGEKMQF